MDAEKKGAWLLAHSKNLDNVIGAGRLENILYAGKTGRLFNLLRRNIEGMESSSINADDLRTICQANGIDVATRETGLRRLQQASRIDVAPNSGAITILGATSRMVLETTAEIFDEIAPSNEELAVLHISEKVAETPTLKKDVAEYISDTFHLSSQQSTNLIDVCRSTSILDQADDRGYSIIYNNNTFRDSNYALKAFRLMDALAVGEQERLQQLKEMLTARGAVVEQEAQLILGFQLYQRVVGVGLFDRLEVSNTTEAVGYLTSPDAFQKYGRPFEDDPIDDAKALLASFTYGMTRSSGARGAIRMPVALLRKMIAGERVGGVAAIGEDYRELEKRQVLQVIQTQNNRYAMRLLKKDVGELALAIVQGSTAASEALLMEGSAAQGFKGPAETRKTIRDKHTLDDSKFVLGALDRLRSGG